MQNEKSFYSHYNEIEYNDDYVKLMKYSYMYLCKSNNLIRFSGAYS